MLTKTQENDLLGLLKDEFGVTDAYFSKGVLYVVNDYDVEAVEDFMDVAIEITRWQLVTEDAYA